MSLLLDTHALIWWLEDAPMTAAATERISDPDVVVAVSAATLWEIAIKQAAGKLRVDESMVTRVAKEGFEPLAITWTHAEKAGALPLHHRDPFDRMLIAQAQAEGLTLVTRDRQFEVYDVDLLVC